MTCQDLGIGHAHRRTGRIDPQYHRHPRLLPFRRRHAHPDPGFAPLLAPKRIEADDRPPPPRPQAMRLNRALTLSGWLARAAACAAGRLPFGPSSLRIAVARHAPPPPRGADHGAARSLAGDHGCRPLTWHASYELVSVKINLRLGCQSPVLEGNGARLLFDRPLPLPPPEWLLDGTLGEPDAAKTRSAPSRRRR